MKKASQLGLSSSTDLPDRRVPIGWISRAHGIKGEVVVVSDSSDDPFSAGRSFQTEQGETLTVASSRMGKHGRIVGFVQVTDRTQAESLRGRTLTIGARERRTLESDEFWPEDLIGLTVVDRAGTVLGAVTDVVLGAAQDRLVVATELGAVDVPFVDELVPTVDLATRTLELDPPVGLFSEEE